MDLSEWLSLAQVWLSLVQVFIGLLGVGLAALAAFYAWRQLKPLKHELARIAQEQRRRERMREFTPRTERSVVGFDARFSNRDWNKLLADDGPRPDTIQMRLSPTHAQFHSSLEELSHESVAIVDLVHVPELLCRKLIAPLTDHADLNLDRMLKQRADLLGLPLEKPAVELMRALCSDHRNELGALPLWINTHGRMIAGSPTPDGGGRISQVSSFDDLLQHSDAAAFLTEAGVQSGHLIFEFWAHLAYRNGRLFSCSPEERRLDTDLLLPAPNPARTALAEALADLAVRLHFFRVTREQFRGAGDDQLLRPENAFDLAHTGDARMIRHGVALWKPVFSSELLALTLPEREGTPGSALTNETEFRPPFARYAGKDSWRFLTALGGYGVVLPASAQGDESSVRAVQHLFLRNPRLMHPYVDDMLPADSDSISDEELKARVSQLVGVYAQPRLPFWPELEQAIVDLLLDLLLRLSGTKSDGTPHEVWRNYVKYIESCDGVTRRLAEAVDRFTAIAGGAGWTCRTTSG